MEQWREREIVTEREQQVKKETQQAKDEADKEEGGREHG